MTILIATPLYPPDIGGPAAYAKALREEWTKLGMTVRVVAYGRLERALPAGLRHLVYLVRMLVAVRGVRSILALDTWSVGVPALVVTSLLRKRLVFRVGGDFLWESYVNRTGDLVHLSEFYASPRALSYKERLIRRTTGLLLRSADAIAFNTAWQLRLWRDAYQLSPEKVSVIQNFFPAIREHTPATNMTFVAASRATAFKNHALLARVFERVQREYSDARLDMRALPPAEHRARIRDCYAVIIPSVSEVNSNTAIDAVAAGKPFLAPVDSGGYEVMKDLGLWVDTLDEQAFAEGVRALLDPVVYAALQERIRAFSYTHSWEAVGREFLALLV